MKPGSDYRGSIQMPDYKGILALSAQIFPIPGTLPAEQFAAPPASSGGGGSGVGSCAADGTPAPKPEADTEAQPQAERWGIAQPDAESGRQPLGRAPFALARLRSRLSPRQAADGVSEVSYSEWGEQGSVDLLAWHESTANLLVVEIKTELASVEATLRKHDEKVRLAPSVAAGRFGWRPASVGRLLVFPEDRTERRRVAAHASVMDGAYPMRSREVRAWCRWPSGPMAGLMFLTDSASSRRTVGRGRRERVRDSAGKRG